MSQLFAIPAFFDSAHLADFGTLNSTPGGSIIVLDESIFTNAPFNPTVPAVIQNYHNANLKVLGYVPTFDADVPQSVKQSSGAVVTYNTLADLQSAITTGFTAGTGPTATNYPGWIDLWYQYYPMIDGIFIDMGPEPDVAPVTAAVQQFYHNIYTYVGTKSGQHIVLLNASQYEDPAGEWIMSGSNQACDIAILWETEACEYFFNWPSPPPSWWLNNAYAARIAHTIFHCRSVHNMKQVVALSRLRGPLGNNAQPLPIPYLFVTDRVTANYNQLPPYWNSGPPDDELTVVQANSVQVTPAMSDPRSYDFYVRDWTASPTSHDTGQQPSTNPVFYTTSDVWNSLQATGSAPFNSNDQPVSDDVQPPPPPNSANPNAASNYAYTRVARNPQYTDAAVAVAVQFLWADFGSGTSFQYVSTNPNPNNPPGNANPVYINFDEGVSQQVLPNGVPWNIPASHSDHVCLAVEISNACDRIQVDLNGKTPGATGSNAGDPVVRNDNNIAQRNLRALPAPMGSPSPMHAYAIIHNGALFPRDIEITYEVMEESADVLELTLLEVIDQQGKLVRHIEPASAKGTITLEQMQPGENRWLGVALLAPKGSEGQLLPVLFYEVAEETVVSGYALALEPAPMSSVLLSNLRQHANKFLRLAAAFAIDDAKEEGEAAQETIREGRTSVSDYLHFLQSHVPFVRRIVYELGWSQEAGDPFGIRATLKQLHAAVSSGDADQSVALHSQVLQKLDAFVTLLQKAQGDTADILQTVRWQRELYSSMPLLKAVKGADHLIQESEAFIDAYQTGNIDRDAYPNLIHHVLSVFHHTAEALEQAWEKEAVEEALEQDIAMMERHIEPLPSLQKWHRTYLLKLQRLGKKE